MGWQLVAFGKLPYLQTWDQNFPAIVYVHALAISLFNNNTIGFRTLDIILQLGSVLLLFSFSKRYFGRTAAIYSALLFTALYVFYGQSTLGQRDLYAAPMILAALLMLLRCNEHDRRELYRVIISGICLGVAILFRPTYAFAALPLIYLLSKNNQHLFRDLFSFGAAVTVAVIAGFAPYLSIDALEQVYLATVRFNLDVYGSKDFYFPLSTGLEVPIEWLFTPLLAVAAWWLWKRSADDPRRREVIILIIILVVIFKLVIYWMGKYFMYQYGPILYLSAPIIASTLIMLFDRIRLPQWSRVAIMCCALLFLTFKRSPGEVLLEPWDNVDQAIHEINARYKASNWNTYDDILAITDHIRKTTSPSDKIETCSWDNQLIWRSEREQSSRFTLIHPLGMKPSTGYTSYQQEWRTELAQTIADRVPKLVLLATKPFKLTGFLKQPPGELLLDIPGFRDALDANYSLDTTIACWEVYRRKD